MDLRAVIVLVFSFLDLECWTFEFWTWSLGVCGTFRYSHLFDFRWCIQAFMGQF